MSETINGARVTSPDCGIIILGAYNNLDVSDWLSQQSLTQVVKDPTRVNSILDLLVTNLKTWYNERVVTAPIESSDHNTVLWYPKAATIPDQRKQNRLVHSFPK